MNAMDQCQTASNSVASVYPELWHYTTAIGLDGIFKSKQLWASNIRYLNDEEEFTGFFNKKLNSLIMNGIRDGLKTNGITHDDTQIYNASTNVLYALREATLKFDVYVTSFSHLRTAADSDDGILSQWRGYGHDGGYAIVFDTESLEKLLKDEGNKFSYAFGNFSNVDYVTDGLEVEHKEAIEWENSIQKTVARMIREDNFELVRDACEPIVFLATRHKHRGFSEESEIRIVVVLTSDEAFKSNLANGDLRPRKPVCFMERGGILVPYIKLFERAKGEEVTLPIKRIVVGPHPDKYKRQKSVQMLVDQLGIEAEVVVSSIPYIGR